MSVETATRTKSGSAEDVEMGSAAEKKVAKQPVAQPSTVLILC